MQQAGYSVSREVLLAIRQGNQQRVEHLVEGLVAALRLQRSGSGPSGGDGRRPHAGAPQDAAEAAEAGGAPAHAWGQGVNLGASVEQFSFAVQRLSRMPLGAQRAPFWDEVSGFVTSVAGELRAKELALFGNAFATGAPEHLAGPLGAALLRRAAAVADELSARDLVMVMHGLSRAAGPGSPSGADLHAKTQGKSGVRMPKEAVRALAWASRRVRLEEDRPQQAALLLNAFVRLQHTHDAKLFGRWFGFTCKTLPAWDAQALALLCKAFAAAPLAQALTTESGWRAVAGRCAAVVGGANGRDMATLAQTLQRLSVPPATVAEFYDRLERLLVERRRIVDFLTAGQFAMVAQGLGRHRQPPGSAPEAVPVAKEASEAPAVTASLAKNTAEDGLALTAHVAGGGSLDPPGAALPATEWPFEEHAERRMRDFTEQDLAFVLDASVRLRRGGAPLLRAISRRLTSFDGKLSALVLGKICESTVKAVPLVGLSECIDLLKGLRKEFIRLTPQLIPWEVSAVVGAYAMAGAAPPTEKGRRWRIWKSKEQARTALDSLLTRAEEVSPSPEWLESVHSQVRLIMEAEGLLVKPAPVQQAVHRESSVSARDPGE